MSDPIWFHWKHVTGMGKKEIVKCNYCNSNKQRKHAPKCRNHTIKCSKTPTNVKKQFVESLKLKNNIKSRLSVNPEESDPPEPPSGSPVPSASGQNSDEDIIVEEIRPSSQMSTLSSSSLDSFITRFGKNK